MGQCIAAIERYKDRRFDRTIHKMTQAAESKTEMYKRQADLQAGKVRKTESLIDSVKSHIHNRKPTPKERSLLLDLMRQKAQYIKRKDMLTRLSLGAENEQFGMETMAMGKEAMKQNKVLLKGFNELKKDGYNVGVIDNNLDKFDEAKVEMGEINDAVQDRLMESVGISEEEMRSFEAELDDEFNPNAMKQELTKLPISRQTTRLLEPTAPVSDDPVHVVAQVLIDNES